MSTYYEYFSYHVFHLPVRSKTKTGFSFRTFPKIATLVQENKSMGKELFSWKQKTHYEYTYIIFPTSGEPRGASDNTSPILSLPQFYTYTRRP